MKNSDCLQFCVYSARITIVPEKLPQQQVLEFKLTRT